jgi:ABC-type Na+ efflux pump permease subunit
MSASVVSRNSRPSRLAAWSEWGSVAAVACGGASLAWYGNRLTSLQWALTIGLLLLILVVGLRRGWIMLFGPVLFYDLVRTARRSRSFLLRGLYAAALLGVLFFSYSEWFGWTHALDIFFGENYLPPSAGAHFAEEFFTNFLIVQFGMVFLLTPAYTATAIAEEKERRTLDFLLATDLRGREIVLGKGLSRLAHLSLFILAGLPVLAFLQFLGGIDPNLVLVSFAGTALTMLSLASVGILNSAYVQRPRAAIFLTYLEAGVFLVFSYPTPGLQLGNLFVAWEVLEIAAHAGALATEAPIVLRNYAAIHGAIAVLCCVVSAARLRNWGSVLPSRTPEPQVIHFVRRDGTILIRRQTPIWPTKAPRLTGHPLLWKELHFSSALPKGPGTQAVWSFLVILGLFFFFLTLLICALLEFRSEAVNIWMRVGTLLISAVLLLRIALRSSVAFSSERERQTLDALLATPQSDGAILWAKGWGSIYTVRYGWWTLAAIWGLAILFQGLHPLVAPLLIASWLAHAALIAGIGLWFSLVSRTSLRATIYTLLSAAALYFGPILPSIFFWSVGNSHGEPAWFGDFRMCGISPFANLLVLACYSGDFYEEPRFSNYFVAALVGIPVTAVVATAVWGLVWGRFQRATGRMS